MQKIKLNMYIWDWFQSLAHMICVVSTCNKILKGIIYMEGYISKYITLIKHFNSLDPHNTLMSVVMNTKP